MFKNLIIVLVALFIAGGMYAQDDDIIWMKETEYPNVYINSLQLSPTGDSLIHATVSSVLIRDAATGDLLLEFDPGIEGKKLNTIALSGDGKFLAVGGKKPDDLPNEIGQPYVVIWDLETKDTIRLHTNNDKKQYSDIMSLKFGVINKKLYAFAAIIYTVYGWDGGTDVYIWEVDSRKVINILGFNDYLRIIELSHDNKLLAVVTVWDDKNLIAIFNTDDYKFRGFIGNSSDWVYGPIHAIAFSNDDNMLISMSGDYANIVDMNTGSVLKSIYSYGNNSARHVDFGANDNYFVVGGGIGLKTSIWNIENENLVYSYREDASGAVGVLVSKDNDIYTSSGITITKYHGRFEPSSVKGKDSDNEKKLFPNPSNSQVIIIYYADRDGECEIKIIDQKGRIVDNILNIRYNSGENEYIYNCSNLSVGIYIMRIISPDFIFDFKLIKEK